MKPSRRSVWLLIACCLAACGGAATEPGPAPSPTIAVTAPTPTLDPIAGNYGFPTDVDPAARYLFYLHGRIVEDQGLSAVSPEFGEYEYEAILSTLASHGFIVISEQRPKDANGWEWAERGAGQITQLRSAGVPAGQITVVGASKGATIATAISYLVGSPDVNYVLLGTCHPSLLEQWRQQGLTLSGNVLAIYDYADDEYSGSCEELFARSEGTGLNRHDELVLQVGTGHGILYQPLDAWVLPTVRWANQDW